MCVCVTECAHASQKLRKCSAATAQTQLFWFLFLVRWQRRWRRTRTHNNRQPSKNSVTASNIWWTRTRYGRHLSLTHAAALPIWQRALCIVKIKNSTHQRAATFAATTVVSISLFTVVLRLWCNLMRYTIPASMCTCVWVCDVRVKTSLALPLSVSFCPRVAFAICLCDSIRCVERNKKTTGRNAACGVLYTRKQKSEYQNTWRSNRSSIVLLTHERNEIETKLTRFYVWGLWNVDVLVVRWW